MLCQCLKQTGFTDPALPPSGFRNVKALATGPVELEDMPLDEDSPVEDETPVDEEDESAVDEEDIPLEEEDEGVGWMVKE